MDIMFIPFPFMRQPRSLAGHKGAGKESSSKNSLCGSPPGIKDTAAKFPLGNYGHGNKSPETKGAIFGKNVPVSPCAI